MAENLGAAIGWDDEGQVTEGQDFEVLPAGEYKYEVVNFKRERYGGGKNMCACNVAVLQLKCENDKASGTVFARLYLNTKVMFRITNFFKSAGLVDPRAAEGAPMPMSLFDSSVGCTGRCKIKVRKYKGNDGKEYESNDVDFIVPKVNAAQTAYPQQQPQAYQPPQSAYSTTPAVVVQQQQSQPQPQQQQPQQPQQQSWGW